MSKEFNDTSLYINRELSQLEFNRRVLAQATDEDIPLLERLKFLAICSNNMDEFFEIRVAGLKRVIALDSALPLADGFTPIETLTTINEIAHEIVAKQYDILNKTLLPELTKENIVFIEPTNWQQSQADWIKTYYMRQVLPVISPIGLDFAHPFPRLVNKSLNFIFSLEGTDAFGRDSGLAVVHVPRSLPRVVSLPTELVKEGHGFILLSSIIEAFCNDLFPGMTVTGCYQFRVTRNSDLEVEEDDVDDLAHALKGELFSRRFGDVVRLEVSHDCPKKLSDFLLRQFKLTEEETYRVDGPVNFNRLLAIYSLVERPELKYAPLPSSLLPHSANPDVFDLIRQGDILLHHPYQSFSTVVDFVHQAASDPHVLAIRQTLYRTGSNSVMVRALIEAAKSGKEVTAVIELRARFDEEDNIELARNLQEAGAMVVYGVPGFKTHAKMTLVVRRENQKLRRYVHLGTGNYHTGTAKQYTDFSLLTCDPYFGEDVHKVFQQLSGMGQETTLRRLIQAPFKLHDSILSMIENETAMAKQGKPAKIMAKLNALSGHEVIQALYSASQAGVEIQLIVRGICCLKPQLKGISENIHVYSIVGRFLEHSRVYYFENGGDPKVFCASADWMGRNFFNRVEVCFPIKEPLLQQRVIDESLAIFLDESIQRWSLDANGDYILNKKTKKSPPCAQEYLLNQLK